MVLTLEKIEGTIRQACKSPSMGGHHSDTSGKSGYQSLQEEEDPANPQPLGGVYVEPSRRNRSDSQSPVRMPTTPGMYPEEVELSVGGSQSGHRIHKSESEGSMSSARMVEKFSNIPWHVRGRAEAWEIQRSNIKFIRKVGEGMGGVVFLCRWRGLDCAAKLLSSKDKGSVEYHDMVNEISTISHLRHPGLVLFLGAITVEQPLLILSEYMAGGSLEDRYALRRKETGHAWRPPLATAYAWIRDLARALCFLHSCTNPSRLQSKWKHAAVASILALGRRFSSLVSLCLHSLPFPLLSLSQIIHRDLKPANLLLTDDDRLKVSDFGLCKTLQKVKEDGTPYTMTAWPAGCTGTKRYMAPEVVLSHPNYDEKVDVYSMAMIVYFIVVGERPFEQTDPELISVLAATRGLRPDAARLRWPAMKELVETMWEEDPARRPSARELVEMLGPLKPDASTGRQGCSCNVICTMTANMCAIQ